MRARTSHSLLAAVALGVALFPALGTQAHATQHPLLLALSKTDHTLATAIMSGTRRDAEGANRG